MILLITAQQIIEQTYSYKKTDTALIKDTLIFAMQEDYIKPILGEDFYEQILTEFDAGPVWTGNNQVLYEDYLYYCLLWYGKAMSLTDIVYQDSSQGIMNNTPNFSSNTLKEGLQQKTTKALRIGDIYKYKTEKFLRDNKDDFPLWEYCKVDKPERRKGIIIY